MSARFPLSLRLFFTTCFCLCVCLAAGCSGKQVHVTAENEFNTMAKRLAPALKAHGVIDEHGAYAVPVFSAPELPPQLGEYLFQRLSPAFRFKVDPTLLPPTFALSRTAGDTVEMRPYGFMLGQGADIVTVTLLAQVDSALGGKTALDLPEGKNLLGAFHQPSLVLSDPACLATLPQRQFASGMAEVIKTGLVADSALLAAAEQGLRSDSGEALTALVAACGRAKLHLVSGDAEDHGARRLLNFGHTFGHGYEAVGGYDTWTHGEAVAAGMCRTLRWQIANGYGGTDVLARLEPLLTRYGLPTAIDCDEAALRRCVGHDKKTAGGTVQLVIVRRMGQGELVAVPLSDLWEDKA